MCQSIRTGNKNSSEVALKQVGQFSHTKSQILHLTVPYKTSTMSDMTDLTFSVADYCVLAFMLLVSFGIGVYHAFKSTKNKEEFVMGSREFGIIPMAISLCAR